MDQPKKIVIMAIVILMAVISVAFYIQNAPPAEAGITTRTITDMGGNQVQIPAVVKSAVITCCGGASHEFAVLGAQDLIIGQPKKCISDNLLVIMPEFADTPDVGSFDNVNVEDILRLNPDIVVGSVTAKEGNGRIKATGIPVVEVLTGKATLETLPKEFEMVGIILGREEQANKLVSYWDEKLALVKDRTSHVPENERKKVYYMLGGTLHTNGRSSWGHSFVTAAGGINVAESIDAKRDIVIEELLNWNPGVIITSSNEGVYITADEVKNNAQLSDILAVKDNKIYECPIGTFWWDRPSPESPLGILWLAKALYPEEFADISIEDETRSFFNEYYHYNLTDDEITHILHPKL